MELLGIRLFEILWLLLFVLFFATFVYSLGKSFARERKNNHSPRLTVDVVILSRRTQIYGKRSQTMYYATFQVPSGDRMELEIPNNQFGYLVEGDRGQLTFQGTRFLEFHRN